MIESINNIVNNTTRLVKVDTEQVYQPGKCNIGIEEREKIKTYFLMGSILAVGYPFICYIFVLPVTIKLLVFFPAIFGVLGLWQYRKQYSIYHGISGIYNFGNIGQSNIIEDQKNKAIDRKVALKMLGISVGISLIYALLAALLL